MTWISLVCASLRRAGVSRKQTLWGKGEISSYTARPQATAPNTSWDSHGLLVSDAPHEDSTANSTGNITLSLYTGTAVS